jgi:hypothetical protein
MVMKADEKECPFCAEVIKEKAIKCRHCGANVSQSIRDNDSDEFYLQNQFLEEFGPYTSVQILKMLHTEKIAFDTIISDRNKQYKNQVREWLIHNKVIPTYGAIRDRFILLLCFSPLLLLFPIITDGPTSSSTSNTFFILCLVNIFLCELDRTKLNKQCVIFEIPQHYVLIFPLYLIYRGLKAKEIYDISIAKSQEYIFLYLEIALIPATIIFLYYYIH